MEGEKKLGRSSSRVPVVMIPIPLRSREAKRRNAEKLVNIWGSVTPFGPNWLNAKQQCKEMMLHN